MAGGFDGMGVTVTAHANRATASSRKSVMGVRIANA